MNIFMRFLTVAILVMAFFSTSIAQVNFTANDVVLPYTGQFRMGVNMGWYPGWDNQTLADISAGNPLVNQPGVGARSVRVGLYEEPFEFYGYNLNVGDFQHYNQLGMGEYVALIGQPSPDHRDYLTNYCPTAYANGNFSAFFANMYEPIWDGGLNGTPYNDDNYLAAYLYKTATIYKDDVRFWEIWNEPGFDLRSDIGGIGWRDQNFPGNWWLEGPPPCDNILQAPIYHYIRVMRIAWEVIKTVDPDSYVCLGSVGYQSFLNAMLRNTDNPNGGDVSPDFPLTAGAYFDCITFHSYPHFDGSTTNFDQQIFQRHSDRAADGVVWYRDFYQEVLDQYGYDGITYPKKQWIVTEINSPRKDFQSFGFPFFAGFDAQINHLMKAYMVAKVNDIHQLQVFQLIDRQETADATYEFDLMGMYKSLNGSTPYGNLQINDQGIAVRTMSKMLFNTEYDAAKTAAMNIPANARGYAFKRPDGSYIYAVWAKTQTDLSENAFATYSFPASFGLSTVTRYNWNFTQANTTQSVSSQNIFLDARPVFFTESPLPPSCAIAAVVNNVLCNDNGTPNNPNDDTFTFSLTVNGSNTSTGWSATVKGQTVTGTYGQVKSFGPYPISGGNVSFIVSDQTDNTCITEASAVAPEPCSNSTGPADCASSSQFPWHDWIAGVQIGSINNNSSKNTYSDFRYLSTNLFSGQTTPINLTTGYSWVTYNSHYRIWIDFNKNGTFETNEKVFEGLLNAPPGGTATGSLTGLLTVPANAPTGSATMRVSMQRGDFPPACEDFEFGEVEDYSVNIVLGTGGGVCGLLASVSNVNCSNNNTPNNPTDDTYTYSLLVTGANAGSGWKTTVNGQNISGQYGVPKTFGPYPIVLSNINMSISDADSTLCSTSATAVAPPPCSNGGPVVYCTSTSNFPWHEWISAVQVANLDNASGKSTYSDFSNLSATLVAGQAASISLTSSYSWETFANYWSVWIDLDKNGTFEANELVFSKAQAMPTIGTASATTTGTINIPAGAELGSTRMRVSMKRGVFSTACETVPEGEVEDYSVTIVPSFVQNPPVGAKSVAPSSSLFLEAQSLGSSIKLDWKSDNRREISMYLIEKSINGQDWTTLATVPFADAEVHSFTDFDPSEGENAYRIKAILVDGRSNHSLIRRVLLSINGGLKVYPNPTSGLAVVDLSDAMGRRTTLRLFDAMGRVVQTWSFEAIETPLLEIDMARVQNGQYFLHLSTEGRMPQSLRLQKF